MDNMKKEEKRVQIGDKVKWNDPGIKDYDAKDIPWLINRVFEIIYIEGDDDDDDRMVYLSEVDGGSEAQAWEHELVRV